MPAFSLLAFLMPPLLSSPAEAGLFRRKKGDETAAKKGDFPPYAEVSKGLEAVEGAFDFYRDPDTGKVYWSIGPDQWDTDFLLSSKVNGAVGERGLYGTIMMDAFVFQLHRQGDQVQLIKKNLTFRADDGTPEARALPRSFSDSILTAAPVASMPAAEGGAVLVDLSALFAATDLHNTGKRLGRRYQGSYALDASNSMVTDVQSFERNSELQVTARFVGDGEVGSVVVPKLGSMSLSFHYSLMHLPENDYQRREADGRVGYFLQQNLNFSDTGPDVPYEQFISRWYLEKEDPTADLSDPVQPIVFWLENTVPERYRAAMTEGVLWWNAAFEQAGFSNAVVVKQQPDDATWDPADVRYNTIRWFLTYDASFAIGPSHMDPRTGQLLDADIGFSDGLVRFGAVGAHTYWVDPVSAIAQMIDQALQPSSTIECGLAAEKTMSAGLVHDVISTQRGWSSEDEEEYVRQYVAEVTAHEVGHTLGLRHNFIASARYDMETLLDWTEDHRAIGTSVMDYNPPVVAPPGQSQGPYLPQEAGPYDRHAIEYGYRVWPDAEAEAAGLQALASKSADPDFQFATDEDAGFSGANLDPRVSRYDFSDDPLAWYAYNLDLVDALWENLDQLVEDGEDYDAMRAGFNRTWRPYIQGGLVASKYVGGAYQSRAHRGDAESTLPFTVVPAAEQRRALQFLSDQIWAPGTFDLPPDLLRKLQMSQLSDLEWSVFSAPRQDYPLHEMVAQVQTMPLSVLFDPARMARIIDQETTSPDAFSLAELFSTLHQAIWFELEGGGSIESHRRQLQQAHVDHLTELVLHKVPGAPADAISLAHAELRALQQECRRASTRTRDTVSRAHLARLNAELGQVLTAEITR